MYTIRSRAPELLFSLQVDPRGGDEVKATLTLWTNWERNVSSLIGVANGPEKWVASSLEALVMERYPLTTKKED